MGEFCTGEIAKKACRESFVPEALLKALTVSVSMCGRSPCGGWLGLVLWAGCFEGCWLLLVVLCPLARVLVG